MFVFQRAFLVRDTAFNEWHKQARHDHNHPYVWVIVVFADLFVKERNSFSFKMKDKLATDENLEQEKLIVNGQVNGRCHM